MTVDRLALAAWNAANKASRDAYHADMAVLDGWCGTCQVKRRGATRDCRACITKRLIREGRR